MVSEKFILWEQMITPPGGQLEPQGHGWQHLLSEPLCIATHFGLHIRFFKVYPIKSLWKLMTLRVYVANLDSMGMHIGTIYVEDHRHCFTLNI